MVEAIFEFFNFLFRALSHRFAWAVQFRPLLCETFGQQPEIGGLLGKNVDGDEISGFPIRRNLQDGGSAQSLMCEQDILAEACAAKRHKRINGNSSESLEGIAFHTLERKWHESRPNFSDP